MIIKFNRRKIETYCLLIAFVLVIILTLSSIFAIADQIFNWDILPENIENIVFLFMWASGLILIATFLISLMTNLSIISLSVEKISGKNSKTHNE
ncbi:MAG: hypothetical protein QM499_04470 [Flavobacteriaceae bacterium]